MAFKTKITFLEGDADDYYIEEEFDSEEEAKAKAEDELSNWFAGADVLGYLGEGFIDPSTIGYEIEEL